VADRRAEIRMSDAEALAFLAAERVVACATNGHDGWPHVMPLWYVVRDGELWAWTYAASQKARNLERDPRATLQVEAGDAYEELRGVMLRCETELVHDTPAVAALGVELFTRYAGGEPLSDAARAAVERQASKRVALRFRERSRATWDHRKLAAPRPG
jgi:PPOX class probable F420-dependent enzyme